MAVSAGIFLIKPPCLFQSTHRPSPFYALSSKPINLSGLQTCSPSRFRLHSTAFDIGGINSESVQDDGNGSSDTSYEQKNVEFSLLKSTSVRLVGEDQSMRGIVPKSRALELADLSGLDLVVLSKDADPPVVKMTNYKKYMYDQKKKKKQQQQKANRVRLKELKMGYNIGSHDYAVRLRAAQKFLKRGDKVKVVVCLKGRENEFKSKAIELIRRFQNDVGSLANEEGANFKDSNIYVIIAPNKAEMQKVSATAV